MANISCASSSSPSSSDSSCLSVIDRLQGLQYHPVDEILSSSKLSQVATNSSRLEEASRQVQSSVSVALLEADRRQYQQDLMRSLNLSGQKRWSIGQSRTVASLPKVDSPRPLANSPIQRQSFEQKRFSYRRAKSPNCSCSSTSSFANDLSRPTSFRLNSMQSIEGQRRPAFRSSSSSSSSPSSSLGQSVPRESQQVPSGCSSSLPASNQGSVGSTALSSGLSSSSSGAYQTLATRRLTSGNQALRLQLVATSWSVFSLAQDKMNATL